MLLASAAGNAGAVAVVVTLLVQMLPILLVLVGLFSGRYFERKHLRYLDQAESEFADIVVSNLKTPVGELDLAASSSIVDGQVVIANDALKSFLSGFRKIFGGEMRSYEVLMERARREATVRMLTAVRAGGFNAVCNMRVDFSSVMAGQKNSAGAIEVLVTATAYKLR